MKKYIIALACAVLTTFIFSAFKHLTGWNIDYFSGWFSASVYLFVVFYFEGKDNKNQE